MRRVCIGIPTTNRTKCGPRGLVAQRDPKWYPPIAMSNGRNREIATMAAAGMMNLLRRRFGSKVKTTANATVMQKLKSRNWRRSTSAKIPVQSTFSTVETFPFCRSISIRVVDWRSPIKLSRSYSISTRPQTMIFAFSAIESVLLSTN
jgi:hypothetical protein